MYLQYLVGLNYWSTNTLFIVVGILLFFRIDNTFLGFIFFFLLLKFSSIPTLLWKKTMPATLYYGTIVIHPILFYISLTILVLRFSIVKRFTGVQILYVTSTSLFYLLTITLLLGGFWGLQSIAWGYVWVNDWVECLLVAGILYILKVMHFDFNPTPQYIRLFWISCLLNFVLLVRLNILTTRHSFITNYHVSAFVIVLYLTIGHIFSKRWSSKVPVQPQIYVLKLLSIILISLMQFLYLIKYLLTLTFFFVKSFLKPKFFSNYGYLHFVFFCFIWGWCIFFVFFFINFYNTEHFTFLSHSIYSEVCLILFELATRVKSFSLLEQAPFNLYDLVYRLGSISFNYTIVVQLNNWALLWLVFLFLI